ncbi:6585_t:CDS:2 [Cetraspora pellucida]|uniref:6585_t:CDS:1 n=1 Tax=Cetraspora pellucida TaxID=1433469 RepID=A0A9N9H396_9GLOM|nr:6585_t:CDS:2 [Cetraspora pellucida]
MELCCDYSGVYNNFLGLTEETRKQQLESVAAMTGVGLCSRKIISTLRQNDESTLALVDELQKENFLYNYECDNEGVVTYLFFAYNKSVALTRQYPFMLLIDCTYKTNIFKMPLLNFVGCIPVTQIEEGNSYNEDLLQPLLQNLEQRYYECPEHQQM